MLNFNHNQFMAAAKELKLNMSNHNTNLEIVVSGAVALYWQHNKNTAYLEKGMMIAKAHKGLRVNAVKSFYAHFTGLKAKKDGTFGKVSDHKNALEIFDAVQSELTVDGELVVTTYRQAFEGLNSWQSWIDANAQEPQYDHKAAFLSLVKQLETRQKKANENEDAEGAQALAAMLKIAKVA